MSANILIDRSLPTASPLTVPFREMLGYDPFRRLLPNVEPEMEVVRNDNGWDVEIPVAGYRPDHIQIEVKDDVLTISAKSDKRAFTRSLRVPQEVDMQNIEATVEYGMLSLALTRHPEAEPRKIAIKERSA